MRRILSVLAVMALLISAFSVPAFAAPSGPGPNSFVPIADKGGPMETNNFGHCQTVFAQRPGSAYEAKFLNPARETGQSGVAFPGILCANTQLGE